MHYFQLIVNLVSKYTSYCTIYLISKFTIYFNWYQYVSISIGCRFQLVSRMFYLLFQLVSKLVSKMFYLLFGSKFTIYFNWYLNVKYFLSLVSKFTNVSIQLVSQVSNFKWYQNHVISQID